MKKLFIPMAIFFSLRATAAIECEIKIMIDGKPNESKIELKKASVAKDGITSYEADKAGYHFEVTTYPSNEIQKMNITEKVSRRRSFASYDGMKLSDPKATFYVALANEGVIPPAAAKLGCQIKQ